MSFGSAEAFQADVVFRTNVSQFEGDQAQIRALAERTYGALDAGSLKAALASEKYDRALARSKGSAFAVAKATAAYKSELASLEGAENRAAGGAARHSGALRAEERAFGGVIRGGIAGSGVLNRFGRAAIFASSSLLGGYGLIYGLRTVVHAARDQEVALAHLQVAVTDTGLSWTGTRGRLDDALGALVKTTAFTRDDLTETLATAVRRFGDVDQALNATGIATDVARAKGIDLASAMSLLIRASLGQSKSVKALGVDVTATSANVEKLRATTGHATAAQIANAKAADQQANRTAYLDAIQAHYHGNAARYLQTSAGKQALFNAELRDTEEIIGAALLPTLNTYLGELSTWLDKMNKSGRLQHDVNRIVHDGTVVLHDAGEVVKTVDHLAGGFKHTLELLLSLKLASTFLRWEGALGGLIGTGGASGGTGLSGAEAKASRLKGTLGSLARLGTMTIGVDLLLNAVGDPGAKGFLESVFGAGLVGFSLGGPEGAAIAITADVTFVAAKKLFSGDSTQIAEGLAKSFSSNIKPGHTTNTDAITSALGLANREFGAKNPLSDALHALLAKASKQIGAKGSAEITAADVAAINDAYQTLIYQADPKSQVGAYNKSRPKTRGAQDGPPIPGKGSGKGSATGAGGTGGGGGGGTGTGLGGLPYGGPFGQNALLEAEGTAGTADDLQVLNAQLGYLNKALAQKGLTPQDRNQLLNERNSVLQQRDQIVQAAATARKQASDAAARKQRQQYAGLTQVPAFLVKRFADAEAAHKPASVLQKIRREEQDALRRQEQELKKEGAPETYVARVAKEIDTIQARIDAATRKARKDRIAKLDQVPVGLRLEEANAIANNASAERLAAIYAKEKKALDDQLVQLKKIHATKQEILKNREAAAAVEKKLTAIEKQQKADTAGLARELQDAVAGLAQYAPNVTAALASIQGGPVVNNHQYFPHPPTADGSREAIFARHALLAAFDG